MLHSTAELLIASLIFKSNSVGTSLYVYLSNLIMKQEAINNQNNKEKYRLCGLHLSQISFIILKFGNINLLF